MRNLQFSLTLLIFMWVSLMRENQIGLRENVNHKIPTLIQSCYGRPRRDHICCFNFAISNTERNGGCSFCLIGNVANIPYYWWIHQMFSRFCSKIFLSLSSWKSSPKIVFCYQNCSDLLWEKIVIVIEKNCWNSRLKAENFQKFWDH